MRPLSTFLFLLAAFLCANLQAQNVYLLSSGYTVTIHGTSNLHDWDETVETVTGMSVADPKPDGTFDLNRVYIKMDANSIKSEEGFMMDKNTRSALKADDHPNILFVLNTPIQAIQPTANQAVIAAKGNLTIAGVTKPVEMQVKVLTLDKGKLTFEGSKKINMTDYGITPPTALFGALKTGDEITIHFKTTFHQSSL